MHDKKVADIMTRGAISCPLDTLIPDVARTLTRRDISAIVVVDDQGHLAGLISRGDLVALYSFDEMWPHLTAEKVMTRQVATVRPDQPAVEAATMIHNGKITRVIVTESDEAGNETPIGILSITDIVRDMSRF